MDLNLVSLSCVDVPCQFYKLYYALRVKNVISETDKQWFWSTLQDEYLQSSTLQAELCAGPLKLKVFQMVL